MAAAAFGQLAVGPPGAGKTTFIAGMQQLLGALQRPCVVVNLDFGNDSGAMPYDCDIDVRDLATVAATMDKLHLGPNGSLLWCMEYLEANLDWLEEKLLEKTRDSSATPVQYFLFDSPGQVELYTHHSALRRILCTLVKRLNLKLTAVHLTDSILCTDPSHFISGLLVSLSAQMHLELPHVNLLTKVDLLHLHSKDLAFQLEYYVEVQDLRQLIRAMEERQFDHPFNRRFTKLNEVIAELVEDFNLVGFFPLSVEDKKLMLEALKHIDTANGFALTGFLDDPLKLFSSAGSAAAGLSETLATIQENYIDAEKREEGEGRAASGLESVINKEATEEGKGQEEEFA